MGILSLCTAGWCLNHNRKQKLIKLHPSKVGPFSVTLVAYLFRSPKEIVDCLHYSPARLTVTSHSSSAWLPLFLSKWSRFLIPEVHHAFISLHPFCWSKFCNKEAAEPFASTILPAFGRLPLQALCSCVQATKGNLNYLWPNVCPSFWRILFRFSIWDWCGFCFALFCCAGYCLCSLNSDNWSVVSL